MASSKKKKPTKNTKGGAGSIINLSKTPYTKEWEIYDKFKSQLVADALVRCEEYYSNNSALYIAKFEELKKSSEQLHSSKDFSELYKSDSDNIKTTIISYVEELIIPMYNFIDEVQVGYEDAIDIKGTEMPKVQKFLDRIPMPVLKNVLHAMIRTDNTLVSVVNTLLEEFMGDINYEVNTLAKSYMKDTLDKVMPHNKALSDMTEDEVIVEYNLAIKGGEAQNKSYEEYKKLLEEAGFVLRSEYEEYSIYSQGKGSILILSKNNLGRGTQVTLTDLLEVK
ncbi:hypothetical protein [uncultured Clostridium sp.]|jgi:hypothetical protein|uniref:hypothetical protein n=1 Tax=uncultured Clostridium sp. TaxID=59620 RepID=UPI0026114D56|nr:hypothetical protein [uncultured Clostridium sp.]